MIEFVTGDVLFGSQDNYRVLPEWILTTDPSLPVEWGPRCLLPWLQYSVKTDDKRLRLTDYLYNTYFNAGFKPDFTQAQIGLFGDLLDSMFRYRAEERPTAAEVLRHPWFGKKPWG